MTEDATTAEKFEQFHRDNPIVYATLCSLARDWLAQHRGWRTGIGRLTEVCRWEIAMQTNDPEFKINNSFRAYYARLIMKTESDLDGIFDLRASAADRWVEIR